MDSSRVGHDFSLIPVCDQYNGGSADSLFEREETQPEDTGDAVGLAAPTAGTHDDVLMLKTTYGAATPQHTLAYGFTAWSPRRSATFPIVKIDWTPVGAKWIGVVRRATAIMGAVIARYLKPGTYQIPGASGTARYRQCGPTGKRVSLFSKVSQEMSRLANTAEQEHCNDYQRAFDLSLRRRANLTNAIAGKRLGPNTRRAIEELVLRRTGGMTARQWVQELNRLTRLSLTRDGGAHLLKPDGEPKTCPADCSRLVYATVNSPTTRIPGPSSEVLIN